MTTFIVNPLLPTFVVIITMPMSDGTRGDARAVDVKGPALRNGRRAFPSALPDPGTDPVYIRDSRHLHSIESKTTMRLLSNCNVGFAR